MLKDDIFVVYECIYICIYINVCMCICIHGCIYIYICMYLYLYVLNLDLYFYLYLYCGYRNCKKKKLKNGTEGKKRGGKNEGKEYKEEKEFDPVSYL